MQRYVKGMRWKMDTNRNPRKIMLLLSSSWEESFVTGFQFLRPLVLLDITLLLCWAPAKGNKHTHSFEFPAAPRSLVYAGEITTKKQLRYLYHCFHQKVWKNLVHKHTDMRDAYVHYNCFYLDSTSIEYCCTH